MNLSSVFRHYIWCLVFCFSGFLFSETVLSAPDFPVLSGRVVDTANIIPEKNEAALALQLKAFEKETSNQLIVVTLKTLNGYAIDDYGYQLARYWSIGQKEKNNGVLIIIALTERKLRIEVGYGLEGSLTDALSSDIIQKIILPKFKQDDLTGGIEAGATAIIKIIKGADISEDLEGNNATVENSPYDVFFSLYMVCSVFLGNIIHRTLKNRLFSIGIIFGVSFIIAMILLNSLLLAGSVAVLVSLFDYFMGGGGDGDGGFGGGRGNYYSTGYGGGFGGGGFSGGGGSFGGGGASGGW